MNRPLLFGLVCLSVCATPGTSQKLSAKSSIASALFRDLKTQHNKHVRPNADSDQGGPTIWVNLHCTGIEKLKDRTNVIQVGFSVDMRWNDPRMAWNQDEYANMTNLFFPLKHMWTPDITIWQSADPLKPFLSKEQKIAQIFNTGDILWATKARMSVYANMSMENQTGSTQYEASALLGSWALNDGQIDIQPSQGFIDQNVMHWSPLQLQNSSVIRYLKVFNDIPNFDGFPLLQINLTALEPASAPQKMIQ